LNRPNEARKALLRRDETGAKAVGGRKNSSQEVLEANVVSTMEMQSNVPVSTSKKSNPVEAETLPQSTTHSVTPAEGSHSLNRHNFRAVARSQRKGTEATKEKVVQPRCTDSQRHILAEQAVDLSEILLGAGLYEMIPMKNRVRLAARKAASIRKIVAREKYDRLSQDLPTKTLPMITPAALLQWLDAEFKDVIDAVFFVDSPQEFAKLLETFAQGIAANFFGDQVKVRVEVNHLPGEKAQQATSDEVMSSVRSEDAKMAPQVSDLSGIPSGD